MAAKNGIVISSKKKKNESEIASYFRAYWLLGNILLRSPSQQE